MSKRLVTIFYVFLIALLATIVFFALKYLYFSILAESNTPRMLTPEEEKVVVDSLTAPVATTTNKPVEIPSKVLEALSATTTLKASTPSLDEEQQNALKSLQL